MPATRYDPGHSKSIPVPGKCPHFSAGTTRDNAVLPHFPRFCSGPGDTVALGALHARSNPVFCPLSRQRVAPKSGDSRNRLGNRFRSYHSGPSIPSAAAGRARLSLLSVKEGARWAEDASSGPRSRRLCGVHRTGAGSPSSVRSGGTCFRAQHTHASLPCPGCTAGCPWGRVTWAGRADSRPGARAARF